MKTGGKIAVGLGALLLAGLLVEGARLGDFANRFDFRVKMNPKVSKQGLKLIAEVTIINPTSKTVRITVPRVFVQTAKEKGAGTILRSVDAEQKQLLPKPGGGFGPLTDIVEIAANAETPFTLYFNELKWIDALGHLKNMALALASGKSVTVYALTETDIVQGGKKIPLPIFVEPFEIKA